MEGKLLEKEDMGLTAFLIVRKRLALKLGNKQRKEK